MTALETLAGKRVDGSGEAIPSHSPKHSVSVHAPRPSAHPRVVVRNAVHAYGDRIVLASVDLSIRAGEIYGLVGANGAGKTTLMKAICGRMPLTRGAVWLDGADPARDVGARSRIGFVPQEIAVYPYLTVRENLEVFARLAGVPHKAIATTVDRTVTEARLAPFARQLTRTLSGGYQRRVNICASILHDPALLVLDEPTVGIDIDARAAIHGIITALRDRGTAILLTTHDMEQAQELCDRVGFLTGGRIVREGPPAKLIADHFGDDGELIATLRRAPDDAERAILESIGFMPTRSPATWFGHGPLDQLDAGVLTRQLSAAGMAVAEIRIRRPDLGSLFIQIAGGSGAS